MKILEVRDGFIKFESYERFPISSFIRIEGETNDYIAQIVRVNKGGESATLYAKMLFCYNGNIYEYDNTIPSKDALITEFSFDLLNKDIQFKQPITIGSFISNNFPIIVEKESLNKNLLISYENFDNLNLLLKKLTKNLNKSSSETIIIDMLGQVECENKFVAGKNFKLPLDSETLSFIYEDCLNDATQDSKDLIKEIFKDLSIYSQTVDFLPFAALKDIIDEMVEKSHIFKLLVLKNKLNKFDKLGYFAADCKEATNLGEILNSKSAVIDLSKLDSTFQNRYIASIYYALGKKKEKPQIFVVGSNSINKTSLKTILTSEDISSVFVTHPRFKFINDIKPMFKNFIIEPTFINNEVFKPYSHLLNQLKKDTYLIDGEFTENIPLVSTYIEPVNIQETDEKQITISEECLDDINENEDLEKQEQNINTEKYSATIDKKSEALIEKLSTEIEKNDSKTSIENIFNENDDIVEENLDSIGENTKEFSDKEFHTNVDNTTSRSIIDSLDEVGSDEINEQKEINEIDLMTEEDFDDIGETIVTENVIENPEYTSEEIIESDNESNTSILDENSSVANEVIDANLNIAGITVEEDDELALAMQNKKENSDDVFNELSEESVDFEETTITLDSNNIEFIEEETEPIALDDDNIENLDNEDTVLLSNDDEIPDDVILVDISDQEQDELEISGDIDQEIIEDVDKVFTTIKDDSISDSDLDFIDELNSDSSDEDLLTEFEEIPEQIEESEDDGFLETLKEVGDESNTLEDSDSILETRSANTPIVPVYDAEIPNEDKVISDPIDQGDNVYHATFGNGVVVKMIKYGTKSLYYINFDNVGRRLLDPTLTEIKKI